VREGVSERVFEGTIEGMGELRSNNGGVLIKKDFKGVVGENKKGVFDSSILGIFVKTHY